MRHWVRGQFHAKHWRVGHWIEGTSSGGGGGGTTPPVPEGSGGVTRGIVGRRMRGVPEQASRYARRGSRRRGA